YSTRLIEFQLIRTLLIQLECSNHTHTRNIHYNCWIDTCQSRINRSNTDYSKLESVQDPKLGLYATTLPSARSWPNILEIDPYQIRCLCRIETPSVERIKEMNYVTRQRNCRKWKNERIE